MYQSLMKHSNRYHYWQSNKNVAKETYFPTSKGLIYTLFKYNSHKISFCYKKYNYWHDANHFQKKKEAQEDWKICNKNPPSNSKRRGRIIKWEYYDKFLNQSHNPQPHFLKQLIHSTPVIIQPCHPGQRTIKATTNNPTFYLN